MNKYGTTALMYIAEIRKEANIPLIEKMLELGADPNKQCNRQDNAMKLYLEHNNKINPSIVLSLLRSGFDIDLLSEKLQSKIEDEVSLVGFEKELICMLKFNKNKQRLKSKFSLVKKLQMGELTKYL